MKKDWTTTLIKRFYGLTGPLDEYRKQEINQIGNYCFIFLASFLLLGNFIALLFAHHYPTQVAWVYPIVVEIAVFIAFGYVIVKTARLKLLQIDVGDFEEKQVKQLKWLGLRLGASFAVGSLFITTLINSIEYGTTVMETLTKPQAIAQAILSGLFFGTSMHLITKFRMAQDKARPTFKPKTLGTLILLPIILVHLFRLVLAWVRAGQVRFDNLFELKELMISVVIGLGFSALIYLIKESSQTEEQEGDLP